jgi:hypothetical protein
MNNIDERYNLIKDELQGLCDTYGYQIEYKFGVVFIRTKYEAWNFVPAAGKIKLRHMSTHPYRRGEYHTQFIRQISIPELIEYIHGHETDKYIKRREG